MKSAGNCGNGEQAAVHEPRGTTHHNPDLDAQGFRMHPVAWHNPPRAVAAVRPAST